MKNKLLIVCSLACIIIFDVNAQDTQNYYTKVLEYKGYHYNDDFTFRKVDYSMPLIAEFPLDSLRSDPRIVDMTDYEDEWKEHCGLWLKIDEADAVHVDLAYWILDDIKTAEDLAMDRMSRPLFVEFRPDIDIGDNCWKDVINWGDLLFIRNNIFVQISDKYDDVNHEVMEYCARIIDDYLLSSDTVDDKEQLPFPVIHDVRVTRKSASSIQFEFDIADGPVWYRSLGDPTAIIRYNTDIVPQSLHENQEKYKILVYNEEHYTTSYEYFTPPPR